MKHSEVFYTLCIKGKEKIYTRHDDAHALRNPYGLDLFYIGKDRSRIIEGKTGLLLLDGKSLEECIQEKGGSYAVKKLIDEAISIHGLSPRYTNPNEKRVSKPKSSNPDRFFKKCLYEKGKCYFYRFYNENDIQLYIKMKESKYGNPMVYILVNDWMIPLEYKYNFHRILEEITKPSFDIHMQMCNKFKKQMSDPTVWVDIGVADYLGRKDEAEAHNKPLHEKKIQEEIAERKRDRESEQQFVDEQNEKAYMMAGIAATLIRDGIGEIKCKDSEYRDIEIKIYSSRYAFKSQHIILYLAEQYNVEIPLRVKGWIRKRLERIYFFEDGTPTYSYYPIKEDSEEGDSSTFDSYLSQLTAAIRNNYAKISA